MAVHSGTRRLGEDGATAPYPPSRPPMRGVTPLEVIRDGRHLIGASLGWDRAVFDAFGPLPAPVMVEDRPIAFRAALLGEIAWIDEALLDYRTGGNSDPGHALTGGLYGQALKVRRWERSFMQGYLADMERVAPPDAAACRALARETPRPARLRDRPRRGRLRRAGAAAAAGARRWRSGAAGRRCSGPPSSICSTAPTCAGAACAAGDA